MKRVSVARRVIAGVFFLASGPGQALAALTCTGTQMTSGTGNTETGLVTFIALGRGDAANVAGRTLTCPNSFGRAATAAQVAAYMATGTNSGDNCTAGGALANWTAGAASSDNTVLFTSTTPNTNVTDLSATGVGSVLETQGTGSLSATLSGNTVCRGTAGAWLDQEYHSGTGGATNDLIEYHLGTPADPNEPVGKWTVSGTSTNTIVTYNYNGGAQYQFTVFQQADGTFEFCPTTGLQPPTHSGLRIEPGQIPCS